METPQHQEVLGSTLWDYSLLSAADRSFFETPKFFHGVEKMAMFIFMEGTGDSGGSSGLDVLVGAAEGPVNIDHFLVRLAAER